MATDIAFSVGVISLLGRRVSLGAKLFLLALAIADDVGAIVVIAIFYTSSLAFQWLLAAALGLVVITVARRIAIRSTLFYAVVGTFVWFFVLESGVHATIAGVVLGLMTPVTAYYTDEQFRHHTRTVLGRYGVNAAAPNARERIDSDALELSAIARESVAPLDRLERALVPWSSFVIVPLFALANAGVAFFDVDIAEALTSPVALGVSVGLVVGKLVGITAATLLAVRFGIGTLPTGTGPRQVVGLAAVAGIGFTVSLFITELAFTEPDLIVNAKTGIFLGSLVAGILGYTLLRTARPPDETRYAHPDRRDPDVAEAVTPVTDG
jgi:NhaA family Na+:H+ antiporter